MALVRSRGWSLNSQDDLLQRRLHHLKVTNDSSSRAIWIEFKYRNRPCFSRGLLEDVARVQRYIQQVAQAGYRENTPDRLLFQVISSSHKHVFNLGGDLAYFIKLIGEGNRDGLRLYAKTCIDIQHACVTHYNIPFTTIALVDGAALGGGFEAALSSNILIAEPRARFGFPEITFGMFPGMGALSLLVRKITPALARRLIMDHRVYTGEELYELGIVDVLAPDGEGRAVTTDYMRRHASLATGLHAIQAAIDRAIPVKYSELSDIVDLWVDAALQLSEKNRRLMSYFARAQSKRFASAESLVNSDDFRSAQQ